MKEWCRQLKDSESLQAYNWQDRTSNRKYPGTDSQRGRVVDSWYSAVTMRSVLGVGLGFVKELKHWSILGIKNCRTWQSSGNDSKYVIAILIIRASTETISDFPYCPKSAIQWQIVAKSYNAMARMRVQQISCPEARPYRYISGPVFYLPNLW